MNNANRSGGKMMGTKNKQRGCGKALGGGKAK